MVFLPQEVIVRKRDGEILTSGEIREFIAGLNKAQFELDRKSLSELAIHDPAAFDAIVEKAKAALA